MDDLYIKHIENSKNNGKLNGSGMEFRGKYL